MCVVRHEQYDAGLGNFIAAPRSRQFSRIDEIGKAIHGSSVACQLTEQLVQGSGAQALTMQKLQRGISG